MTRRIAQSVAESLPTPLQPTSCPHSPPRFCGRPKRLRHEYGHTRNQGTLLSNQSRITRRSPNRPSQSSHKEAVQRERWTASNAMRGRPRRGVGPASRDQTLLTLRRALALRLTCKHFTERLQRAWITLGQLKSSVGRSRTHRRNATSRKKSLALKQAGPTLIRVKSLIEYIEAAARLTSSETGPVWYRGHSSALYRLLPSALRDTIPLTSASGHPLRGNEILTAGGGHETGPSPERMLDDFKRRAFPFVKTLPRNDFEWMFLMQHHGVPTRLLDWTTNALVALYFAVDGARSSDGKSDADAGELDEFDPDSAAVFVMNPRKINGQLHSRITEPVDISADYERWRAYSRPTELASDEFDTYPPICLEAPQISPRIRSQAGLFTLHGANLYPLDYYLVTRPLLTKLLVPNDAAVKIRSELYMLGVTPSFIFPDLDGVAKDVRETEARTYAWERAVYLEKLRPKAKRRH